jgi:hypothetical protein
MRSEFGVSGSGLVRGGATQRGSRMEDRGWLINHRAHREHREKRMGSEFRVPGSELVGKRNAKPQAKRIENGE